MEVIEMTTLGAIIFGAVLWWFAYQHDKKMNENFLNFSIRCDYLEKKVEELEIINEYQERDIKELEENVRDLKERLFKFENHL